MKKLILLALALALASCGTPDAAATNAPQWLQVIHQDGDSYNYSNAVGKYCDTETGNLIYIYGSYQGGIAVVPNGCTKNAQS